MIHENSSIYLTPRKKTERKWIQHLVLLVRMFSKCVTAHRIKEWEIIVQFHSRAMMAEWIIKSERLRTEESQRWHRLEASCLGSDSNGEEREAGEAELGRKTMSLSCAPWLFWRDPSEERQPAGKRVSFASRQRRCCIHGEGLGICL